MSNDHDVPKDAITPLEISVQDVLRRRHNESIAVLLDCREREEHAIAHIDGALLIPMSELAARLDELATSRDATIVVHCHHGGRSLRVAQWLRSQGFAHAQSMAGGIDQWAQEIDATVPRY